jgi:hypothetical protein
MNQPTKTLNTLAERIDSWSQEVGLGLFLLIGRLVPNWKSRFLSPNPALREAISESTIQTK